MNEYIELKKYYENLPEDKPEKIIFEILCKLQATLKANKGNEIFLSEADFQFCFAQELDKALKNKGIEQPKIILEYPYSFKQTCKKGRAFIDLYFKFNSVNYFIEFKYKLTSILDTNNKDIFLKRYNKFFTIKSQGASNNGRYLIYQDIERMEKIKLEYANTDTEACKSYVIFITNDSQYWRINQKESCKSYNYPLADKMKIEKWCKNLERTNTKCYKEFKECSYSSLNIDNNYLINWYDFISLCGKKNNDFRILIIDCNNK